MDLASILERIEARLKSLGLSASAASSLSGLSPDAIRNMRRAVAEGRDNASTSLRTISALASALSVTENYLLTGVDAYNEIREIGRNVSLVPIIGETSDGVFMQLTQTPLGSVPFSTTEYQGMDIFALKVTGGKQDEFFAVGSTIICVDADQSGIKDGDNVVLRRWSPDGQLAETSIKTIMWKKTGPEFWPIHWGPAPVEPFIPTGPRAAEGARWAVLGVVIGVLRELTPRGGRMINLD